MAVIALAWNGLKKKKRQPALACRSANDWDWTAEGADAASAFSDIYAVLKRQCLEHDTLHSPSVHHPPSVCLPRSATTAAAASLAVAPVFCCLELWPRLLLPTGREETFLPTYAVFFPATQLFFLSLSPPPPPPSPPYSLCALFILKTGWCPPSPLFY